MKMSSLSGENASRTRSGWLIGLIGIVDVGLKFLVLDEGRYWPGISASYDMMNVFGAVFGAGAANTGNPLASVAGVDDARDRLRFAVAHGFLTGDAVKYTQDGVSISTDMNAAGTYFVRRLDDYTIKLYTTRNEALAAGAFADDLFLPSLAVNSATDRITDLLAEQGERLQARLATQREETALRLAELGAGVAQGQERLRSELLAETLRTLSEHARADRELLQSGLQAASAQLTHGIEGLGRTVGERLDAIGGHVNQRLDEGFRKTNETFVNVMARLATIDEAQKKIGDLTTNVVSLQELLGDKRARGAFGEVQLEALVRNALPPDAFDFQYTLPNSTRADCVLRLPAPTGLVVVDSKFPLENYHRMFAADQGDADRRTAQAAFRADVKKHVDAIASKYILPGVTSDGAVMFVPAEAVFAEIHAYHPEVVSHALAKRVWIVSPTTLMAVLNTARAVLEDSVASTKALMGAKDVQELISLQTSLAQPMVEKAVAYSRSIYEIASQTQEEVSKLFEAQVAEANKTFAAALDKAAKSAPAGSDVAVAAVKSAIAAANSAYDSVTKAAKQVAEIAEANVAAATSATVKAVSTSAPAKSSKKAA